MESIVKDFVQVVERGITQEIDGVKYSTQKLYKVADDRTPKTIELSSLTGFADYLKSKIDENELSEVFVVVEDHRAVSLYQHLDRESMVRHLYVRAVLEDVREFPFGSFIENEDFLIKLRSLFKKTPDQERLLQFSSRISVDDSLKTADDGISQNVTVNKGISGAIKSNETAPSLVSLAPYRTFREVEQPSSEFIFRLRASMGKVPTCALFEADGGSWKLQAMKNVTEWLKKNIKDVTILS